MSAELAEAQANETSSQLTNISATEAAEIMAHAIRGLRQRWIQGALSIANIVNSDQIVGRGTYDDLRHLRERCEELERAHRFLHGAKAAEDSGKSQTQARQLELEDDG